MAKEKPLDYFIDLMRRGAFQTKGKAKTAMEDGPAFVASMRTSRHPEALTFYEPAEYAEKGARLYKLPGIDAGFAVSGNGDIISVHNNSNVRGLGPMQGGKGFGKSLVDGFRRFDPSELQEVYTAVRSPEGPFAGYVPYENQATIRLKIPKKDYLKMDRNDTNPELDFDFRNESHVDKYGGPIGLLEDSDKDLTTVQHGGRTDIFQEKIPPKYIDEVYTENGEWKDPWSFLEEYECDPRVDCDEWYDAISQYLDENGEWDFDKLRKMNKRMGR